jgi:hypothetical protein
MIKSRERDRGLLRFIIEEAKQVLSHISKWKIVHTRRKGNCAAHELAQLALRSNRVAVWRHEVPVCIEQIIAQDCTDPE